MGVMLLKVSLGASLVALAGVSWFASTKGDARGENGSDIASEVSVKTSDLGAKAKEGDTKAFDALEARAEAGDAESQRYLGECYFAGECVSQSYKESVKWLRKAAEQGDAESQGYLGACYYGGKGVSQSYEKAVKWFRKAAEQGNEDAQCLLGQCYFAGKGVSQSYEEAVKWYRKAAEQGNVLASKVLSPCPCETAHLLNVAYEASCNELAKSQQNKEKYLYRLGKVNTVLQAWANLNNHLPNCSSCGSKYKSAQMKYLYQTKSQLDAMHTYLENAVSRGLNGDNDMEDALIKIFEALNRITKPLQNLPPIQIKI